MTNDMSKEALELAIHLMAHTHGQTIAVTNQVLENYKKEAEEAKAKLWAIQAQLTGVLTKGVMPTPDVILNIAYMPNKELVDEYLREIREVETS